MDTDKISKLDSLIFNNAKKFNVLSRLAWEHGADEKFLSDWNKGIRQLPTPKKLEVDFSEQLKTLEELRDQCSLDNPIEKFLYRTADSYIHAGKMLEAYGTRDFTLYSSKVYGRPDDQFKYQKMNSVDAAHFLLDITGRLMGNFLVPKAKFSIPSDNFADWMKKEVDEFFSEDEVDVVLDNKISARALAGARKIKISHDAAFSDLDKNQLLQHEAYIHTATVLNGKKQTNLKCLALGAPRTTRTQEGLAVLAELMTGSMDIVRLRRLALRVIAVKMALDGADFIEVFEYFIREGQTPENAVTSGQRIFRGGDVNGGIVFTKDFVYLEGVFMAHVFFRLAISENKVELIQNLFSGRMTFADAVTLAPYFSNGWLVPPVYLPEWACDFSKLGAMMAYSAFISQLNMDNVTFNRFEEVDNQRSMRTSEIPGNF